MKKGRSISTKGGFGKIGAVRFLKNQPSFEGKKGGTVSSGSVGLFALVARLKRNRHGKLDFDRTGKRFDLKREFLCRGVQGTRLGRELTWEEGKEDYSA